MKVKKCWKYKNADIMLKTDVISFFVTRKCQKIHKMDENIDREILHNFWTNWGIPFRFSGKMLNMIILKVTKKTGFHPVFRR